MFSQHLDPQIFTVFVLSVATIAIAYDNAPFERKPVDWQLPKVWIISTIMGKQALKIVEENGCIET